VKSCSNGLMADERVDSEIVSQFLLNTCRLHPRLTEHAVQAAWFCAHAATSHPCDIGRDKMQEFMDDEVD